MDFDDLVSPNPLVDGNITANSQSYHIFIAIGSVENRENLLDTSLEREDVISNTKKSE